MEKTLSTRFSCDTFVALPPATANGSVVFGKNSDRPRTEVQEVVYCKASDHNNGAKLQCTYIEVPEVSHTHAVVLSKPAWMWGAEMGANEHGVCIGNEAVFTKEEGPQDKDEKLLGMDLVRLGLERGQTAKAAMDVITTLLEEHGQGGVCFDDPGTPWTYHNSFLIADGSEAWVLETAGKHWAAQRVTSGVRNISNLLTIGTDIDVMSAGLKEHAQSKGWWKPEDGDFDFARCFAELVPERTSHLSADHKPSHRYSCGRDLLEAGARDNKFGASTMFGILRDVPSGINRVGPVGSASVGSQVSVLPSPGSSTPACHWFTATPNPACSVFKPFVFCSDVVFTPLTQSSPIENDPAKSTPRFQSKADRRHPLYIAHESVRPLPGDTYDQDVVKTLMELEVECVHEMDLFLASYDGSRSNELGDLFKDIVESEMKFYVK